MLLFLLLFVFCFVVVVAAVAVADAVAACVVVASQMLLLMVLVLALLFAVAVPVAVAVALVFFSRFLVLLFLLLLFRLCCYCCGCCYSFLLLWLQYLLLLSLSSLGVVAAAVVVVVVLLFFLEGSACNWVLNPHSTKHYRAGAVGCGSMTQPTLAHPPFQTESHVWHGLCWLGAKPHMPSPNPPSTTSQTPKPSTPNPKTWPNTGISDFSRRLSSCSHSSSCCASWRTSRRGTRTFRFVRRISIRVSWIQAFGFSCFGPLGISGELRKTSPVLVACMQGFKSPQYHPGVDSESVEQLLHSDESWQRFCQSCEPSSQQVI